MKKIFKSIIILFLFFPLFSQAAVLEMRSDKQEYAFGDSFTVDVFIDIDEECINAFETTIKFPANLLILEDFVSGESLVSVWISDLSEETVFDANDRGELYLAGGIPGGYCGKIPGDPGDSNLVGRLLFRVPSLYISPSGQEIPQDFSLTFSDSRVTINDGVGTEDKLKTDGLFINLKEGRGTEMGDYEFLIDNDNIKPEPFVIELQQNPDMFQGQYFAVFSTQDKQSGVDHYEIMETKRLNVEKTLTEKILDYFSEKEDSQWQRAKTPYLLGDQSLRSIIKVRAIDKAGNQRSVEYIPPEPNLEKALDYDYFIIAGAVLLLLIIIFICYKIAMLFYRKTKSKNDVPDAQKDSDEE